MSAPAGTTLFLCGDVMTGRGLDQVMPHASDPVLYESFVRSAMEYVRLAEAANGAIPRGVEPTYVWGAALDHLDRFDPEARIVNLETTVTTAVAPAPKGINYRMHPSNVGVIAAAGIDCCVLANNHVLDWGEAGLLETLDTLESTGIAVAGAGRDSGAARAPAVLPLREGRRVLVFAYGAHDSGVPPDWAAGTGRPGVNVLPDFSQRSVDAIADEVQAVKRTGDLVIASIHWGGNWGYSVPREHRRFARALIDRASVDAVHGHSSHHPRAIEVYRGHLILYGCGDLLNDYEGIPGYEAFRDDLTLLYFPTFEPRTGGLLDLVMVPLRIRNFRLNPTSASDLEWMRATMDRECRRFGHRVTVRDETIVLDVD